MSFVLNFWINHFKMRHAKTERMFIVKHERRVFQIFEEKSDIACFGFIPGFAGRAKRWRGRFLSQGFGVLGQFLNQKFESISRKRGKSSGILKLNDLTKMMFAKAFGSSYRCHGTGICDSLI